MGGDGCEDSEESMRRSHVMITPSNIDGKQVTGYNREKAGGGRKEGAGNVRTPTLAVREVTGGDGREEGTGQSPRRQ